MRLGVSICEDMWDEFYDVKPLAELSGEGRQRPPEPERVSLLSGQAPRCATRLIRAPHPNRSRKPIVYVNTVGAADNGKNIIPFDGESLVYDARRTTRRDRPAVRRGSGGRRHRRGERPTAPIELPADDREREMYDALVMALRDYMRKTGFTRAIVAVSGGIDSALALAIAVDALGADRVVGLQPAVAIQHRDDHGRLPTGWRRRSGCATASSRFRRIDEHVRRGVRSSTPIRSPQNLTRENLHARIRGLLMMAESNDTGALLISCGNETEIALGYATLYGDMCGGISLIGDLSKMDVYRLARHVNQRHGAEMIPEETFRITPSAELAEGQYDPFDYSVVSPIVGEIVEQQASPEDLVKLFEQPRARPARASRPTTQGRTVYDKYTVESFRALVHNAARRMRRAVYKRLQGPPIVVVSERAFGFDLRETIINKWDGG